jgi:hypothetical protein
VTFVFTRKKNPLSLLADLEIGHRFCMKKNKLALENALKSQMALSSLEDNRLFQWINKNSLTILYAVLAALVLVFILSRVGDGSRTKAERDFADAETEYGLLKESLNGTEQASFNAQLASLQKLMSSHPELHAKYDGPIAQALILEGNGAEAQTFANGALQRTANEESPYYVDFARTSLLISQQHYSDALQNAVKLKETMSSANLEANSLFALNLIRIATLQQQLGNREGELAAWNQFTAYAKRASDSDLLGADGRKESQSFAQLMSSFAQGSISFDNYVEMRRKSLSTRN